MFPHLPRLAQVTPSVELRDNYTLRNRPLDDSFITSRETFGGKPNRDRAAGHTQQVVGWMCSVAVALSSVPAYAGEDGDMVAVVPLNSQGSFTERMVHSSSPFPWSRICTALLDFSVTYSTATSVLAKS